MWFGWSHFSSVRECSSAQTEVEFGDEHGGEMEASCSNLSHCTDLGRNICDLAFKNSKGQIKGYNNYMKLLYMSLLQLIQFLQTLTQTYCIYLSDPSSLTPLSRRGCFLSPRANRPVEVATFGSWVDDYGLDNLEEAGGCGSRTPLHPGTPQQSLRIFCG